MVFVQLLSQLLKDEKLGPRVVPIVADEARTFGMQTLFRQVGIYSARRPALRARGPRRAALLPRGEGRPDPGGGHHRGGRALLLARGGDRVLGARQADAAVLHLLLDVRLPARRRPDLGGGRFARARLPRSAAPPGRTTLAGEGLQHQDGSSHLVASTIPNCRAYDPCFGYELAAIVEDGARRMLEAQEDVFYYLTVANENYAHPAMPQGAREGILEGMYRFKKRKTRRFSCSAAGPILREVLAAAELLEKDWKIGGRRVERDLVQRAAPRRHEGASAPRARRQPRRAGWTQCLEKTEGPVIAASDYVSAVADLIRPVRANASTWPWAPTASAAATRAPRCARSSRSMRATSRSPRSPRSTRA